MRNNELVVGAIIVAGIIVLAGLMIASNQIGKHIDDAKYNPEIESEDYDEILYWIGLIDESGGRIGLITGDVLILAVSDSVSIWGNALIIGIGTHSYYVPLSSVIYFSC